MGVIPFEELRQPISDSEPCGPDLELLGDDDYFKYDAQVALVLPESFATFDRRDADLPHHVSATLEQLKRSRDLRLVATLAKLLILDRDLVGFANTLELAVFLLEERWDSVNPGVIDGDDTLRVIALQSLDDVPQIVQPLQSAPLLNSRRLGALSLRHHLLAEGRVQARHYGSNPDEQQLERVPNAADILSALQENSIEPLLLAHDAAARICRAVDAIAVRYQAASGKAGVVELKALGGVARELFAFLQTLVHQKDPSRHEGTAGEPSRPAEAEANSTAPASVPGAVRSRAQVSAALRATLDYFERCEPSSPVRLILLQVANLHGKSFYEQLMALAPDLVQRAEVRPARDLPVSLPMGRLAELLPPAPQDGHEVGKERAVEPEAPQSFSAETRAQASALIGAIASFLRQSEPSSPVPLILEYANSISGRDFHSLLRDILPADALRPPEY